MSDYKYKAFISYRHLEPDMQAAEKLQKLLEAYKPPKNLVGDKHEKWRIFRDVSELQSSSDLSEDIRNAIESSEFLIVICSPEYNESKWCAQELTHFRELHGNTNENVITLLVHGDPQKAFPEALTYKEVTTTDENGEEVTVKVEVEPLAANITAGTLKESMKKLDTEYLRIAAPLLGCDFNDLYQREKRREAARRRRIFGTVFGILSLITIISSYSAVTISRKNVQIQQQNEQIERQNQDLLVENAGHLAAESEKLYKESSLIPAVRKAVEALPSESGEKPVLPEAEYALSRELGMFSATNTVPRHALKHDCAVEKISFMGGGKSIVSQDATGIYFWDAQTGSLIKKISGSDPEFISANGIDTLTAFFDVSDDKTGTYFSNIAAPGNLAFSESAVFGMIYDCFVHDADEDEPGTGGDVFVSNAQGTLWKLDGATGEVIWKADASEKAYKYQLVQDGGECLIRLFQDKHEMPGGMIIGGSEVYIEYIDKSTGKVTAFSRATDSDGGAFSFAMNLEFKTVYNGIAYFYNSETGLVKGYDTSGSELKAVSTTELPEHDPGNIRMVNVECPGSEPLLLTTDVYALSSTTTVSRFDSKMEKALWNAKLPVNYKESGKCFLFSKETSGEKFDVLAVVTDSAISFINYEDGTVINAINLDSTVTDVSFTATGLVMLITSAGEEYVVSINNYVSGDSSAAAYHVESLSTSVSLCSYSKGKYVTCDDYSNTAYIQFPEDNKNYASVDAGEHIYKYRIDALSSDGSLAGVSAYEYPNDDYSTSETPIPHFYMWLPGTGECTLVTGLEGYRVNAAAFCGENNILVQACPADSTGISSGDNKVFLIETSDLSVKPVSDAPDYISTSAAVYPGKDGAFYLCEHYSDVAFVTPDGKVSAWAKSEGSEHEKEVSERLCAFRENRAALACQDTENKDTGASVEIWDGTDGSSVSADYDFSAGILHIFWLSDETVGVFLKGRTAVLINAEDGKVKTEVSLDGTSQEPVSVMALTGERFAVLCRDSRLYEMSAQGFTGRSLSLEFPENSNDSISANDGSSASMLKACAGSSDENVYAVWEGKYAWLIDLNNFSVRYMIDKFAGASAGKPMEFTSDGVTGKVGFYPVYTTSQLTEEAGKFLTALEGKDTDQ